MSPDAGAVKLSVVTVCWNDFANLQRTMKSLSNQLQSDSWEHVLVDGASEDETVEWYSSSSFEFATRVVSEPDSGLYDAMNKSLRLVNGEYVAFLNAGDCYTNGTIRRILHRIEKTPEWGYARARVVDADNQKIRSDVGRVPFSRLMHLLARSTICHQTVVMRTDLIRELDGFSLNMGTAADYHLLVKAASRIQPSAWSEVDVEFLAGGVSDTHVYEHLWNRHLARVDALALGPVSGSLDAGWTKLQMVYVKARKMVKPLLGQMYLKIRK